MALALLAPGVGAGETRPAAPGAASTSSSSSSAAAAAAMPRAEANARGGWRDVEPLDWRAANARVGAVGGWRGLARELRPPAPSASAPASVR